MAELHAALALVREVPNVFFWCSSFIYMHIHYINVEHMWRTQMQPLKAVLMQFSDFNKQNTNKAHLRWKMGQTRRSQKRQAKRGGKKSKTINKVHITANQTCVTDCRKKHRNVVFKSFLPKKVPNRVKLSREVESGIPVKSQGNVFIAPCITSFSLECTRQSFHNAAQMMSKTALQRQQL